MYVHVCVCVCITSQDEELHVSSVPRLCTVTSYVYPTFKNLHTAKTVMSCLWQKRSRWTRCSRPPRAQTYGDKRLSTSLRVARIRPQSRTNYAMLASLACRTKRSIEYVRHAAPRSAPPPKSPAHAWERGYAAPYLGLWLGKRATQLHASR